MIPQSPTQINRAFKATVGAAHTEDQRLFFQELFPNLLDIIGVDVKTDLIPAPPPPALINDGDTTGIVTLDARKMTEVPTTNTKVWCVNNVAGVWNPLTRRTRYIHPRYDTPFNGGSNNLVTSGYVIQLFQDDGTGLAPGTQIPPTATPDGSPATGGWEFEYESGVLYWTAPPTAWLQPLWIRAYRYVGTLGNFGSAGVVQKLFSTPYNYTAPLAVGDAVYVDPALTDSVLRADSGVLATADAIGVVTQLNFPVLGQCIVQVAGEVTVPAFVGAAPFWGKRIYLGPLGTLQDTAPLVGVVKSLGIARSNNILALDYNPLTVL